MVCLFVLLKIFPNNLVIALFTTLQAVQSGAAIKASAEWWPRWWQWLSLEQISSLLPPLITPRPDYCAAQCCSVICHTVQIPLPSHLLLLLTIVLLLLLKASTSVLRLLLEFLTTVLLWTALWLHSSSQSQPLSLLVTPVLSSFITPIGETSRWSPPPLNIVRSPTYPSPIRSNPMATTLVKWNTCVYYFHFLVVTSTPLLIGFSPQSSLPNSFSQPHSKHKCWCACLLACCSHYQYW